MRLWDLRTMDCQGVLRCPGTPTAAYDPQVSICSRLRGSHDEVRQMGSAHALPLVCVRTALQLQALDLQRVAKSMHNQGFAIVPPMPRVIK